ncbi:hypothetical protein [Aquipuribacter hungaricus]|uniref:Uncharacterized protein n=1 Tax=Aquipuribacter hungaricus TaxID=545624 RepID=A0ABV7WF65_9MICO
MDQFASEVTRTIGGYFNVISLVPSALLMFWLVFLTGTGAPTSPPDWHAGLASILQLDVGGVAALLAASVALGLLFHPLQFTLVQLFEGYWGVSRPAVALREARTEFHRKRRMRLQEMFESGTESEQPSLRQAIEIAESQRLLNYMPRRADLLMPTRLGNVLRHYETTVGSSYGLDAPRVLPHVALVAPPAHIAYLNDQRTLLDLAVRLSFVCQLASLAAVAFLWNSGSWALITLLPYSMAYLFYRGSVIAAASYGVAMGTVVDLNRFGLYEALHVPRPASARQERWSNQAVNGLLAGDISADVRYGVNE